MLLRRIAYLFPGQGAQYPGMGRDFADAYRVAQETFEEADDLLGMRLSHVMFEGSKEELTETRHSQLAIYVMSTALLRVLQSLFPLSSPWACSGLSLGEYTALTASGRLPFQQTLFLVKQRADAMQAACKEQTGTMAVVMGMTGEAVASCVAELALPNDLWVANYNCPGQVVISGTVRGVERGTAALQAAGAKRVLPLQVSGAFHSGLMKSAEMTLATAIEPLKFADSDSQIVMNVPGDVVQDSARIPQYLIQQVTHSVRWEQGIKALERQGAELYIEVGPGKTLAGMNKRIGTVSPTLSLEKIDDLAAFDAFFARSS